VSLIPQAGREEGPDGHTVQPTMGNQPTSINTSHVSWVGGSGGSFTSPFKVAGSNKLSASHSHCCSNVGGLD